MKHIIPLYILLCILLVSCGFDAAPTESDVLTEESSAAEMFVPTTVPETVLPTERPTEDVPYFPSGNFCSEFISSSDYAMDYWLFVPKNALPQMPLVIFLHGIGEVGHVDALENDGPMVSAREIYGDTFPFIALYPNSKIESWLTDPVPETLMELIESVVCAYSIDTEHIIITGHSLGAIGTWNMISSYGDYFSAAVPVSCGCDALLDFASCAKVPIWAFVGDSDAFEPKYEAGMRRLLYNINQQDGDCRITILTGDDHEKTKISAYTVETFQWMLSQ